MTTKEQEAWLAHLSDEDTLKILPYDTTAPLKFRQIKTRIQQSVGSIEVVHRGASSLGISGQGELDIYIPVDPAMFNSLLEPLTALFGKPGTVYPLERARFVSYVDGTKAEIFLINNASKSWLDGVAFEAYLKANPESLASYKKLKEDAAGLSTRRYYRRKVEFINEVLRLANM